MDSFRGGNEGGEGQENSVINGVEDVRKSEKLFMDEDVLSLRKRERFVTGMEEEKNTKEKEDMIREKVGGRGDTYEQVVNGLGEEVTSTYLSI